MPLPPLSGDERIGPVSAAHEEAKALAMEEHWRLLYVAMTRAEEALFIGGALGKREARTCAGKLVCPARAALPRRAIGGRYLE